MQARNVRLANTQNHINPIGHTKPNGMDPMPAQKKGIATLKREVAEIGADAEMSSNDGNNRRCLRTKTRKGNHE